MGNMRNVIRLKDVPSNTIEEAIIILKDSKKVRKFEYVNKFKNDNCEEENESNYVIKEAELVISDYLKKAETDDSILIKKNKKLKIINAILGLFLVVSIIF